MYILCVCILDKRFDSDGSKESSLDSGTEEKPYQDLRKERITLPSEVSSLNLYFLLQTDNDNGLSKYL